MATTIETIDADIALAAVPGFRGQLIARGQARAMIWRDGVLPAGAPNFSPLLSYELHSYGYALLGQGLRLRDIGGDPDRARVAFEQAATALEAVIAKGVPSDPNRDFHYVMAAAAYHLGRFSARAYSLLVRVQADENFSPIERMLSLLMLRNLEQLERQVLDARLDGGASDATIAARFAEELAAHPDDLPTPDTDGEFFLFDGLDSALTDNFCSAVAIFLLALERGESGLVERSLARLREGLAVCTDLNLLPQWWAHRIAIHLFGDLWSSSFHELLPKQSQGGDGGAWPDLRDRFIALLQRRRRAEIDLWPSQIDAAARAVNQSDDLVVSLPTSAGKTRIAELCILRCLAAGKRVIFVTPLRALSAQTETSLQKTFAPLGKTVSALYGSIGVSGFDEDAIRLQHIVVTTPEKLDFALRNDPSLIDDVGLLVFDEGHMIGLTEREVRYEVQIQRLLRRADSAQRRVVCLSAILPDGNQLEDFANWLRRDQPGGLVRNDWRPTRLRYGEVIWRGNAARLNLRVGDERPFVPRFLTAQVPPIGQRRTPFPKDLGELCVATAWRLVGDGQSVLVFCPVRAHVEPFAGRIVDLHQRGALLSLLTADPAVLNTALVLGEEWLGADHPILKCLRLGVAIHHGALPTAFRKEIERLLRDNVLKVTISSPTLAQGLNLSATAIIIHSLFRNRVPIDGSEFKNVVGRAGRAFVDVEGQVLYPIFDNHAKRLRDWEALIDVQAAREMESGLVRLVITLLRRLTKQLAGTPVDQLVEYVLNNPAAWDFAALPGEDAEIRERERAQWGLHLTTLDTAILSMLGEHEIEEAEVAVALDQILSSSLWERSLNRRSENARAFVRSALVGRARFVWRQSTPRRRRGYFLAGVGLETGHALDAVAMEANNLLVQANGAMLLGDDKGAVEAVTTLAALVFEILPFVPDPLPENWRDILARWLLGGPMAAGVAGQEADALQFVEGGLVYRLPWAMEAIRVRAIANGDTLGDGITLEDVEVGLAVAAVETGTLNRSAAMLIQAGFTSRLAAIKAVQDTHGQFASGQKLRDWLKSETVVALTAASNWPTAETATMWKDFCAGFVPLPRAIWTEKTWTAPVSWESEGRPAAGEAVRVYSTPGEAIVLADHGGILGQLTAPLNPQRKGLVRATVQTDRKSILVSYIGPDDLWVG